MPQTEGVLEANETGSPLDELAEIPNGDSDSFNVAGRAKEIDCELAVTAIALETEGDAE